MAVCLILCITRYAGFLLLRSCAVVTGGSAPVLRSDWPILAMLCVDSARHYLVLGSLPITFVPPMDTNNPCAGEPHTQPTVVPDVVVGFDPTLYLGGEHAASWDAQFVFILNHISVDERWHMLAAVFETCHRRAEECVFAHARAITKCTGGASGTICVPVFDKGECDRRTADYVRKLTAEFAELCLRDTAALGRAPEFTRDYISSTVETAAALAYHTVALSCGVAFVRTPVDSGFRVSKVTSIRSRDLLRSRTAVLPEAQPVFASGFLKRWYQIKYKWRKALRAKKRHNAFMKVCADALGAFYKRDLELHSGKVIKEDVRQSSAREKRNMRDYQQRIAAIAREKHAYKEKPKEQREQEVKSKRDKRLPVFQSGKVLSALAGAGGAVLFAKLFKVLKGADNALEGLNSLLAHLKKAAQDLRRHLGKALWAVPFVMVVYYALRHYVNAPAAAVTLVVTALTKVIGPKLWGAISNFFPGGDVRLQSGESSLFSQLLATIFTFSVFGNKRGNMTAEFCKRISMFDRMSAGWDAFLEWVIRALEELINYGRQMFGKERVSIFKKTRDPFMQWARQVDEVLKVEQTGGNISAERLDHMVDLVRQGYEYRQIYRGTRMARMADELVAKIANALMPYQGALNARNNFRFEPAACMLLGGPGIGKTALLPFMAAAVMLKSGIVPPGSSSDDVSKNMFQKGVSEYWNGYAGQATVIMDDAFQKKANIQDQENDYITIIRMICSWSFPLNFADLESKGKIFFSSKFVLGTSNLTSIDAEARKVLQEPDAVVRRINFPYRLRLKEDYSKGGMLDRAAYTRELERCSTNTDPMDRFPWYIWEVAKHDFARGITSDTWTPLRALVEEIAEDLSVRMRVHDVAKQSLGNFVSGFVATPQEPEAAEEELVQLQAGLIPTDLDRDRPIEGGIGAHWGGKEAVRLLGVGYEEFESQKKLWQVFVEFAVGYAIGLLIRAVLCLIYELIKGCLAALRNAVVRKKPDPIVQSNRPAAVKTVRPKDVIFQSVDTSVATNIYANSYKVYVNLKDGSDFVLGQVVFVNSDLAVQPTHFTEHVCELISTGAVEPQGRISFRHVLNHEHQFTMSCEKYLSLKRFSESDTEVEFIRFENIRAHRNIVSNFMRESDTRHLSGYRARLDVCTVDDNKRILPHNKRNIYLLPSLRAGTNLNVSGKKIKRYFQYSAPTNSGDCGAPLSVMDNSSFSGRTCIGIHVAGSVVHQLGYSAVVTQEMITLASDALNIINDVFEKDLVDRGISYQSSNILPFQKQGSFLPLGVVDRPVVICPKTSFYRTSLYGEFGQYDYLPARLSPLVTPDGIIYPMERAVESYSTPVLIYEQPWLRQAVHVAMRPLTALTRDMPRDIYDFDQAVIGIPEQKFRSIPRGTAAGYPYVLTVRNGKKEFFGEDQDYDLTGEKCAELRERVDYIISEAKKGNRLSHIFVDFLKDELRSPEKVRTVATRLISSAPLDYTIAWRMYFGAFSSAVMRSHTRSGMAPGICVYTDWDVLVQQLESKGVKVFDGDFKQFDASEQPSLHALLLEYVNRWYDDGPENARVREVLWLDLVHSRHIGGLGKDQRHVYQWNKSLPSGHPFTTIVNSMYSLTCLVGAYISLNKEIGDVGCLTSFWDFVFSVTYGDDNVSNVHESKAAIFNQKTVALALKKEFGMTYTPGNKTGDFIETTSLDEVTFLKRGFICEAGQWLCPLEKDSFLYTCYWCKNRKLESTIMVDVLENTLEELSLHPQEVWDTYAHRVEAALERRGVVPRALVERMQYRASVLNRTDNWY